MKIISLKFGVFFFLSSLFIGSTLVYETYTFLRNPVTDQQKPRSKVIEIPQGAGFGQVVRILSENNLIDQPLYFHLLAYFRSAFSQIQAGEFEIQGHWTPGQLLDYLVRGRPQLHRVTVPEGLVFEDIAARLEQAGMGERETYQTLKTSLTLRKLVKITASVEHPVVPSLEGFLFPETYFFSKNASETTILTTMIEQFNQNYAELNRQRAIKLGLSDYEVITLASMVEKETASEHDRYLVSAVFHNRLKKKMRLESDPTVIYGIDNFDGNLTHHHLKTPTPYNTYTNFGLPPGPICNPGKAAIRSTLNPADVDYLYFVARGDGSSQFSSNLKNHNEAVQQYQRNRRIASGRL